MPEMYYKCNKCGSTKTRDKPEKGKYALPLYRIWVKFGTGQPSFLESEWKKVLDEWWSEPEFKTKGVVNWALKFLIHKCGNELVADDEAGSFFLTILLKYDNKILDRAKNYLESMAK